MSKVDFRQFKKFAEKWQDDAKITAELHTFLQDFILEMAERIIGKTKERTPVDTGNLRGAWQIGEISGSGTKMSIEILNNMDYASHIEFGRKAGDGFVNGVFMLEISTVEVKQAMPAHFKKAFETFLHSKGIM